MRVDPGPILVPTLSVGMHTRNAARSLPLHSWNEVPAAFPRGAWEPGASLTDAFLRGAWERDDGLSSALLRGAWEPGAGSTDAFPRGAWERGDGLRALR